MECLRNAISELNSIEEEVLREKVKSKLVNRRLQALIRKQRRSFPLMQDGGFPLLQALLAVEKQSPHGL